MSAITAVLKAQTDGTIHLPLPHDFLGRMVENTATLKPANQTDLNPTSEMMTRRKEAFRKLRESGGLKAAIPDPVAWQKELRQDRSVPGRGN